MSKTNEVRRVPRVLALIGALAFTACAESPSPDAMPPTDSEVAGAEVSEPTIETIAAELSANTPHETDGAVLVESVCVACHSVEPPPKLAPPLTMVVRHYMEEYPDEAAVQAAIAAWLADPDPERSAMPAHAIERFGVMPPIPLTLEQREAVATYMVEEFADAAMEGHEGMGGGEGMGDHEAGMGRRGGMGNHEGPMRGRRGNR